MGKKGYSRRGFFGDIIHYDANGKKKLRWLCECQTCHEKEVVLGESIRRNQHKFCSYCVATSSENFSKLREDVEKISKESEAAGYGPITVKQFINACGLVQKADVMSSRHDRTDMIIGEIK